jgi:hypothetical protein
MEMEIDESLRPTGIGLFYPVVKEQLKNLGRPPGVLTKVMFIRRFSELFSWF